MSKINLPPFYVGQKVVYITGILMPKNSIHIVRGIFKFKCGHWVIDIERISEVAATYCCDCGASISGLTQYSAIEWWKAELFRPLEQQSFPLIKLSQIKEKEKEEILIEN